MNEFYTSNIETDWQDHVAVDYETRDASDNDCFFISIVITDSNHKMFAVCVHITHILSLPLSLLSMVSISMPFLCLALQCVSVFARVSVDGIDDERVVGGW